MYRYKKIIYLFLVIVLAINITGCNTEKDGEKAQTENVSLENTNVLPIELRKQPQWDIINNYTEYLGKSAYEIAKIYGIMEYDYYKDGLEEFTADGQTNHFLFSDSIWAPASKCVAVCVGAKEIFVKDRACNNIATKEMLEMFGEKNIFHEAENTDNPFYEYLFDDIAVIFYANKDGSSLDLNSNVIIKKANAKQTYGIRNYNENNSIINPIETRTGELLHNTNSYIEFLGESFEEINKRYPGSQLTAEFTYNDANTGIEFVFDKNLVCSTVYLKAGLLWSKEQLSNNFQQLLRSDNLRYAWYLYDIGYFYGVHFNDLNIYIDSNENGFVNENSMVKINKIYE